jgi:MYXO-CTERM domain-containing protein
MKRGVLLTALVSGLGLGACSQAGTTSDDCGGYGSCQAVVGLDARLMRAPLCVRIEVAPEESCSCESAVTVANDCDYEVYAQNFAFKGSELVIAPGESASFEIVPGEGPVVTGGEQQFELSADGSDFEVVVDYEVTEKSAASGCSIGSRGNASAAWLGLGALALYVVRRRRKA